MKECVQHARTTSFDVDDDDDGDKTASAGWTGAEFPTRVDDPSHPYFSSLSLSLSPVSPNANTHSDTQTERERVKLERYLNQVVLKDPERSFL